MAFLSHDEYFASKSTEVAARLVSIQATVESLLPEASRCISYGMPAFKSDGIFFYVAAFNQHIGIYPPVTQDALLIQELAPYRGKKDNLTFPLNQPLPLELIGRVAVALHRQYAKS